MSAKHTPGPWMVPHFARAEVNCDCGYVFSEFQHGMGSICEVNFGEEDEPREVAEANGRLIAAAPEMLEALQFATGVLQVFATQSQTAALIERECRAIIAKATGEAS